jgi:hypothetical protein
MLNMSNALIIIIIVLFYCSLLCKAADAQLGKDSVGLTVFRNGAIVADSRHNCKRCTGLFSTGAIGLIGQK